MNTLTARSIAVLLGVAFATSAVAAQAQAPAPAQAPNGGEVPASRATVSTKDYRLTPGDKLRVEVYKDAQLSQSLQVRPDGKVTLPLLGDIVATDLTPDPAARSHRHGAEGLHQQSGRHRHRGRSQPGHGLRDGRGRATRDRFRCAGR